MRSFALRRSRSRLALLAGALAVLLALALTAAWVARDRAASVTLPVIAGPEQFSRELGARSVDVRPVPSGETCTDAFLRTLGRRYQIDPPDNDGIERLCLYSYNSSAAARAAAAAVPSNADPGAADWAADVRYFRCGTVIAQYLGSEESNVRVLTAVCGQPFESAKKRI